MKRSHTTEPPPWWHRPLDGARVLALLITLAACGGDSAPAPPESAIGTLAYVVTECRDTPAGFVEHQALRLRRGDREAVTVVDLPDIGPQVALGGFCRFLSQFRFGGNSVVTGAFTRLDMSPDGSTIVFEVTDAFSSTFPAFLTPDQKGLFLVHADGTGLRRLGPPSREAPFTLNLSGFIIGLSFSPDGRLIAFADTGPGPGGIEAAQIVTLSLVTGVRTQ